MRTYKTSRTFHFRGAYLADCCDQPHIAEGYVWAHSLKEAFEKINAKWQGKGWYVGDVEYRPERRMGY